MSVQPPLVETANATLGVVIDQAEGRRPAAQRPQLHAARHADSRASSRRRPALGGQNGDATPGGFGNATGGFNVNGMRNQSNNFLLDGATQQRLVQHRLRAASAAGCDPGVQDPDALLRRRVRPQRRLGRQRRHARAARNELARRGVGVQSRRLRCRRRTTSRLTKPELKQNQFGGSARRPAREEPAVRVRLLRGLQEHARHDRHAHGAHRRRSAPATSRRHARFATRSPASRFRATSFRPSRINPIATRLLDRLHPAARTRTLNRYTRSPERRGQAPSVRRARRLPP